MLLSPSLNIGDIPANISLSGNMPWSKQLFKISFNFPDNTLEWSFKDLIVIPVDDVWKQIP